MFSKILKTSEKHLRRLRQTPAQVLSREFFEIFKNIYFQEHLPMAVSE